MDAKLQFRLYTGEYVDVEAQLEDAETPVGQFLMARKVWLDSGTELRQHRPASRSQRSEGYDRLDNEILAGRRLHEVSELSDWGNYPPELARLYGDEATSADPYTLFDAYLGQPLRDVVRQIIDDEFEAFQVSLLTGLCWLAAAGIAHRAISPDTVLWDSKRRRVLITDFSRSTVFGVPRTPVTGVPGWVPMEQRPRTVYGTVGPRDDVWAAGRLIFFARNQGEDLVDRTQIADSGLEVMFSGLFGKVFGPPEDRPTAWNLLEDGLKRRNPAPRVADGSAWLLAGRERFLQARQRVHPGAVTPPGFNEDIDWMGNPGGGQPQAPGNTSSPPATSATPAEAAPGRATERVDGARAESPARAERGAGGTARPRQFPWRRGD
jgi:serine/threonine protein kinase